MREEKPVVAYTLAMVGAAFQALAAILIIIFMVFFVGYFGWWMFGYGMHPWMMGFPLVVSPVWGLIWAILALVIAGLSIYGALSMNSSNPSRVRTGSTLVLIVSLVAFPTMWGFMIGSLLMFIGSIMGLIWYPRVQS